MSGPLEIIKLKAFVEVAANASYARAAGTLGIAQSVLSRQVSALERTIGGRLFHRTGRGVALTELGERVLPRARALVADAAAFEEVAKNVRDRPTGEVNLAIVPAASRALAAPLVGQLRDGYPGIRLRASEAFSGQVEEWLAGGRVDIAIYNRYRGGRVANAQSLMHADMHLVTRSDHPVARSREIAFRALAEVALALPVRPNSLTGLLFAFATSQRFNLDIRFEAGSTALIREAILASDLATISPPHVFAREIASGELNAVRIVRPGITQTTWMSLSTHRPLSAAARIVAQLVGKLAAARAGPPPHARTKSRGGA
jgi:LysR family nitrogen assimilation transcriptional regulator